MINLLLTFSLLFTAPNATITPFQASICVVTPITQGLGGHAPSKNCQDIIDDVLLHNFPHIPPCPLGYCYDQPELNKCLDEYFAGVSLDVQAACTLLRQNTNNFLDQAQYCLTLPTWQETQACMNQATFDWGVQNANVWNLFYDVALTQRKQNFAECLKTINYCVPCEKQTRCGS